ncbi:integrin beta-PS-like [Epargyreus clarus]|uniref:integrin beta-PS-like n=1 Tax=Epargyreus clarus TaxID=520877 RepID=UPI003C2DAA61
MVMKMNLIILMLMLKLIEINCASYCENLKSCGECIRSTRDNCVWCSHDDHVGNRCKSKDLINSDWCKSAIYDPQVENTVVEDANWNAGEDGAKIVQFKPQFVRIKARPGVPVDIKMSYKPAKDTQLDVYYLIDGSTAANAYIKRIQEQSQNIYETLTNITNKVILGVGSFVEKPALPYSDPNLMNAYSFKNNLPLTNDITKFKLALKSRTEGSNYGTRRAVLDGLMQAMVCKDKIGWREHSRRIIVVFTDGFYHSAGDGKIAGVLQRHDMKCHIDDNMDTFLDYPSISQINRIAKDNSFTIIFAVPDKVKEDYEALTRSIIGAKYVSVDGKEDVAKMVAKEYLDIIENVEITQNPSPYIEIKIRRDCADCKATSLKPVDFIATLRVSSCPPSHPKETVKIGPISLNEDLTVEVEFQCECDCEKEENRQPRSNKCNLAGTYQCGICLCDPNRYGDDCKCEGDTLNIEDFNKCKQNSNETSYCNGRGLCRCGKCDPCNDGFSGQFCEFYDKTCKSPRGVLCSGNGVCTMGECVCKPNWSGDDCGRSTDERACIAPYSHKVCSGNGDCFNGKCVCKPKKNPDDTCRGRYCDDCQEFATKRCEELHGYAYCLFLNETLCNNMLANETDTHVVFVNKSEINSPNRDWYLANWCRMKKEDGSIFVFKYYYVTDVKTDKTTLQLVIQKELEKSPPVNVLVAVGSSLGGILLLGILSLLLWKYLTNLYDKREYAQFMDKARNAGYDVIVNPYFEPAVVSYVNPVHNKDN